MEMKESQLDYLTSLTSPQLLVEFRGIKMDRNNIHEVVKKESSGGLVMDSRGIYDAASRNLSALHGLRESRAGYELTLAVNQSRMIGSQLRWVNGLAQLADSMTKSGARKTFLQFLAQGQRWSVVDDPKFTVGRKINKRQFERQIGDRQQTFLTWVKRMAVEYRWPWDESPEDYNGCNHWD